MSSKTDYHANKVLALMTGTSYTASSDVYLGLIKSNGDEVSGGDYIRQAIVFSTPVAGRTQNTDAVTFPEPTADWGAVTDWKIYDAETSGNAMYEGTFPIQKQINNGDPSLVLGIGAISVVER